MLRMKDKSMKRSMNAEWSMRRSIWSDDFVDFFLNYERKHSLNERIRLKEMKMR